MITFLKGNMFDYPAQIRINTVNCVGVMGKGVALEFKKRYSPKMFWDYKEVCDKEYMYPGDILVYLEDDLTIFNLATKNHWRNPSEYSYIKTGLIKLNYYLKLFVKGWKRYLEEVTVTIPALGCGNGGLDWDIVKPMMIATLSDIDANILIFEP